MNRESKLIRTARLMLLGVSMLAMLAAPVARAQGQTNGVAVSDVVERRGGDDSHRFLTSIYFADPSGNPLEIATFDWDSPG